jgi:micrococcal nuclease
MKFFLLLCSLALVAAVGIEVLRAGRGDGTLAARVTYVIDGDTVVARVADGERLHVRLIGIDTPEIAHDGEPGECFGVRAASLTRSLVLGRQVTLEPGRERHDRYGRLLAYVRLPGDRLVESELLRSGWARTYVFGGRPVARHGEFRRVEALARAAGSGAWSACGGDFHSARP